MSDDKPTSALARFSSPRWGLIALITLSWTSNKFILTTRSSPAYEKPVHLAVGWLISLSLLSLTAARFLQPDQRAKSIRHAFTSTLLSLIGRRDALDDIDLGSDGSTTLPLQTKRWSPLTTLAILVVALYIRVASFNLVVQHSECSRTSLAVFVPAILSSTDVYIARRRRRQHHPETLYNGRSRSPSSDDLSLHYVSVIACWLFGCGAWVLQTASAWPNPTYICPSSEMLLRLIPILQNVGVCADVVILYSVLELMYDDNIRTRNPSSTEFLYLLSTAFLACAIVVTIHGTMWYFFVPEDRVWIVTIPFRLFWAAFKLEFLLCIICIAFMATLAHFGYTIALLVVFKSLVLAGGLFQDLDYFPPQSPVKHIVGFVLTFSALWLFTQNALLQRETQDAFLSTFVSRKTQQRILSGLMITILCLGSLAFWFQDVQIENHPIGDLIERAHWKHEGWAEQALSSHSLAEAVGEYHRRYQRYPPPGFSEWYNFALSRNSSVIDDFDGIMRDIAAFEQFPPVLLRQKTWEAMANPDDDVCGITIRNGKATMNPNVRGTHAWMLEAVVAMISKFEQHLPDIDIGFNINDEPRVMGSFNTFAQPPYPHAINGVPEPPKSSSFSPNRGQDWDAAQKMFAEHPPVFEDRALTQTFYDYAASACPASSSASEYLWDASRFCRTCITSHSSGLFFSNWSSSTNICTQPDLARQHGFYSSPSAFKGSHALYPVFSQSKAPFFADILYPSPWNYLDKAIYFPTDDHPDPSFDRKNKTLFWRGGTTEGLSHHHAWRGFARERFVHLLSSPTAAEQLVLVPSSGSKWKYVRLPSRQLQAAMKPDVKLTEIVRCHNPDCPDQAEYFAPLGAPTDFQAHWGYKYLLDLDGAGFSGRFLPFLRSRSLPFKAALFREWYDDRVREWVHFVPLDLRGHGLWGTLAYFAGFGGKEVEVEGERRGAEIADRGRQWAEKVLRKEDMEVYMFRLLLEWGRLTDDRRGEIGFVLG
ncbi:glycosyltransferase family 90 protein [Myriangium duriaei CBS 260.36]|uniref:Glycosyltransferase family 90 protein n=1 Tax=Myriangium duriaei CBS 260.36 TaxID=1168546 RepID=A0A9P4IWL3_9PEZI|nr:glycosyltransferase family 90 protein [Myriangium duriaei CBS 260.36]